MDCKYCKTPLLDNAVYCHICGKKQQSQSKRRRLRRAQSQGTITKLSGHRENPYWARLPAEYNADRVTRKSLGCYPTYNAAAEALSKAMYVIVTVAEQHSKTITLQNMYDRFTASHYYDALSKSAQSSHRTAWKHLNDVADLPINAINKETFQARIDTLYEEGLKRESLAKVRNLSSLLCREAMGQGLITVNYGQLVQLPKADSTPSKPFSSADLRRIWNAVDAGNKDAMTVQTLNYTGMRPSELLMVDIAEHLHIDGEYWYIKGGSKTTAGKNRIIPLPKVLHKSILTLVAGRKSGPLIAAEHGGFYRLDNWRPRHFNLLMESLGLSGYTPYSCRHTYADLQKRRKADPEVVMRIMGHADYATTVEHYHTTTDEDIARICGSIDSINRP